MMNLNKIIAQRDYTVILTLGDSITEANHCTEGCPGYVALLDDYLRLKHGKTKYALINAGIGGSLISDSDKFLKHIVTRLRPDAVTLMYGMNDAVNDLKGLAAFTSALNTVAVAILSHTPHLAMLTNNPLDYGCDIETIQKRRQLPEYMDAVRECAGKLNACLTDVDTAWRRDILNKSPNEHFKLMHDGIHPNHHGHHYIFDLFRKQLLD